MKYFSIEELIRSSKAEELGIDNSPSKDVELHLEELVDNLLDPLREAWGSAIRVNSGYRSKALNEATNGSSKTSVHMIGYAADIYPINNEYERFKEFVKGYLSDKLFDQCIEEKRGNSRWIHIGYKNNNGSQRKMIFKIIK